MADEGEGAVIRDTKTGRYTSLTNWASNWNYSNLPNLKVGIVGEKASETEENGGGLTMAELGAIQEFGSAAAHIPARSFVRAFFDENDKRIQDMMKSAFTRVMRKKTGTVINNWNKEMEAIGHQLAGEMQGRILRIIPPPNALMTEDRKGFNSPLIDTGQLYAAIGWELENMQGRL